MRTMPGLLEKVLIERYGPPEIQHTAPLRRKYWCGGTPKESCLFEEPELPLRSEFPGLNEVYGTACGGFLIGTSLKVATTSIQEIFGLYALPELSSQPEVVRALSMDSGIQFFMDASNVWFYGTKKATLWVYDAEADELDALGDIRIALHDLLAEWESAVG